MAQASNSPASITDERDESAAFVTLILDETGSMQHCKGAAIAGINEYLKMLRHLPTPVRFTLTLFNSEKTEVRHHAAPIGDVPDLTEQTYQPGSVARIQEALRHPHGWTRKRLA